MEKEKYERIFNLVGTIKYRNNLSTLEYNLIQYNTEKRELMEKIEKTEKLIKETEISIGQARLGLEHAEKELEKME